MVEAEKTIGSALEALETLSPEAAEYVQIFIEEMELFEQADLQANLELAAVTMPNLEDDQNELISILYDTIASGADPEDLRKTLAEIAQTLASKIVTLWALGPVLKNLGVKLPEEPTAPTVETEQPIRFFAPNLLLDRRTVDKFHRACGLTADTNEGSGSHIKWLDKNGKFILTSTYSGKIWLKRNIRELLENGVPVEDIQAACRKLKIDFRVINR